MTFVPPEALKEKGDAKSSTGFVPPEVKKKDAPAAPASPAGITNPLAPLPESSGQTGTNTASPSSSSATVAFSSQRSNILKDPMPTTSVAESKKGLPAFVFNQQVGAPQRPVAIAPQQPATKFTGLGEAFQQAQEKATNNQTPGTTKQVIPGVENIPDVLNAPSVAKVMGFAAAQMPIDDTEIKQRISDSYNQFNANWDYNQQVAAQMPGGENLGVPQGLDRTRSAYEAYLRQYEPQKLNYYQSKIAYAKNQNAPPELGEGEIDSFPGDNPESLLITRNANYQYDREAIEFTGKATSNNITSASKFLANQYPAENQLYKDFRAQNNMLVDQLNAMQDQGVGPGNPEFDQAYASYNELSAKMGVIEQMPGFKENLDIIQKNEIERGELHNQAVTFVKDLYPQIYDQQQETQYKQEMADILETSDYEPGFWNENSYIRRNITNAIPNTLMKAVSSLAYLPKAFGDGDEYGATDAFYEGVADNVNANQFIIGGKYETDAMGRRVFKENFLPRFTETATNLSLLVLGSSAVAKGLSSLGGVLAEGAGASKLSYQIGAVASGMGSTMEGYYLQGIEAGMGEQEAETFSITSGAVQGALELVNPEAALGNSVMKKSAQVYMDVLKTGTTHAALKAATKETLKNTFKYVAGENAQEILQQMGEYGTNYLANEITGTNLSVGENIGQDLKEIVVMTTLVSGLMGGMATGIGAKSRITNEALYFAATDAVSYKAKILKMTQDGEMNPEKAELLTKNITAAENALAKMPEGMSQREKIQVLPHMLKKAELEEKQKKADAVYKPVVQEDIDKVDQELRDISGIKSPEEINAQEKIKDGDVKDATPLTQEQSDHLEDMALMESEGVAFNEKETAAVKELKEKKAAFEQRQKEEAAKENPESGQVEKPVVETVKSVEDVKENVSEKTTGEEAEVLTPEATPVADNVTESLDEKTTGIEEDAEPVEGFKRDISLMNTTTGNILSKDGVVKKFVAVSARINQARKDGKITNETAVSFLNAAKNARNRRVADPLNEAEQRVINTLRSLKITSGGDKVVKMGGGLDLESIIHLAFRVAERSVLAGSDIKVATDKAIDAMRRTKTYQRLIKSGSAQDKEIENRIRMEMADQAAKMEPVATESRTHQGAEKILANKFVNEEVKQGLRDLGTEYKPYKVDMQVEDAKNLVYYFAAKEKTDELMDLVEDDTNGMTPTTRSNVAIMLQDRFTKEAAEITLSMKTMDKDSPEYKTAEKKANDLFRKGSRMIKASILIGSEAGRALQAQKKLHQMLVDGRVEEIVGMIRADAETVLDQIVSGSKKKIARTTKEINQFWKDGLREDKLKDAIEKNLGNNLFKLDKADTKKIVDQIVTRLMAKDVLDGKSLEKYYRETMRETIFTDDVIANMNKEMETVRERDEQAKLVDNILNEWKEKSEEAKLKGEKLDGAVSKGFENLLRKEHGKLIAMELRAQEAVERASKPFKDPRDIYKTLTGILKMRTISVLSLAKNLSGYLPMAFITPAIKIPASAIDWAFDKIVNTFRAEKIGRSTNFLVDAVGYKRFGVNFAFREAFRRAVTGHVNPEVAKLELSSSINAVDAFKDVFRGRNPGERNYMENKIAAIIETLSPDADFIGRMLAAPDILVRKTAEEGAKYSMAKNKGLTESDLWQEILHPDEDTDDVAKEIGARAAYQNSTVAAEGLNSLVNYIFGKVDRNTNRHVAGILKFLVKEPVIMFTTTPLNLLSHALKLSMWEVSLASGIWNVSKSIEESKSGNTVKATYYRGRAIESFTAMGLAMGLAALARELFLGGALRGAGDKDKDVKGEQYQYEHPNSMNFSAAMRKISGDPEWARERTDKDGNSLDTWIHLGGLGSAGMALGIHANVYASMSRDELTEDTPWNTLNNLDAFPFALRTSLDQSYLAGVNQALTAISTTDPNGRFTVNYLKTLSNLVIPNTLAAVSKSSNEYLRETKADGIGEMFKNSLKERLFMGDQLPTKVTVWGQPVKSVPPGTNRVAYYFFDPLQSYNVNTKEFGYKLFDFYNNTTDKDLKNKIIPSAPDNKITINKQSIELSPKEHEEYQVMVGQWRARETEKYVNAGSFATDIPEVRVKNLERIYSRSRSGAQKTFIMNNDRLLLIVGGLSGTQDTRDIDMSKIKFPELK